MRRLVSVGFFTCVVALAGCGGSSSPPVVTPTARPTSVPTATPTPVATATPAATPTASAMPSLSPAPAHFEDGIVFRDGSPNALVALTTTLTVPAEPPASGILFLWPGLEPNMGSTFDPVGLGVLQPVLTWGGSCAPGMQPASHSTWWISGEYVNGNKNDPSVDGCRGGDIMTVNVGDRLNESFTLSGTTWTQTITDQQTAKTVTFALDLGGQSQNEVLFVIEGYSQSSVSSVVFTDTSFTFLMPPMNGCTYDAATDPRSVVSQAVVSNSELTCQFASIALAPPFAVHAANVRSDAPLRAIPDSAGVHGR